MRRFSQRNSLVTLNDINITPLLDLAFVLLIIFIITTPLLEQGIDLKLPAGGKTDRPLEKRDIRTVEINPKGVYLLDRQPRSIDQVEAELVQSFRANPNTVVYIRADENGMNKYLYAVIERCQRHGITRFSLRTAPVK
ncbi:MAG: biopolymer transporter ExbD [Pedosphaera sp.]|nr:biopolymer transporter ExbD [Pedosphaera sp.]MST00584.1 biopolymer transporter ExbD [Pedosphaera sp.]